jgi:hypothetical protein
MRYKARTQMFKRMRLIPSKYVNLTILRFFNDLTLIWR